tara:strand:+ start:7965 stop:8423 length:459 start_codon:yes stop_codon:yes gene_type:complete
MYQYKMEHVCTYRATLESPVLVSSTEGDIRANFYVTGGEVWGPKLKGKVLPIGGDWLTLRADGVCALDVRAALESEEGAHIDVAYNGILDMGPDGHANFLKGEVPDVVQIRAAPRLRTAHPDYQWVNRVQFINIGEGRLKEGVVQYDVYALG